MTRRDLPGRDTAILALPLIRIVLWVVFVIAAVPTRTDPDLWGNVRFGLDIVEDRAVSTLDRYSFTQDLPWINHDWLFQAVIALLYSWAGTVALTGLKVALAVTTLVAARRTLATSRGLLGDVQTGLILWAALPLIATLRAQVVSWLFIALLALVLIGPARRARPGLPLLFLVWANAHVGWVVGLGFLIVWAIGEVRSHDTARGARAAFLTAAAGMATLVNPYGPQLWGFALRVSHVSRDISEWQPLWTSPSINWIPTLVTILLVVASLFKPRRPSLERVLFLALFGYLSIRALKFSPFFVECALLMMARSLPEIATARSAQPMPRGVVVLNSVAATLVIIAGSLSGIRGATCLKMADWRPDPIAAHALIAARPSGRIVAFFDWAEYVIWHLGPQLKVSFDPRYDLMYSSATIAEQRAVAAGLSEGRRFLTHHRPEYVWFPQKNAALKAVLADVGYRFDIETEGSYIAVRSDLPALLEVSVPATSRCFPEP